MKFRTPSRSEIGFYIKDLLRDNLFKLAVFAAVFLLGAVLGFRSGLRAASGSGVTDGNFLILLYVSGRVNVFSYVLLSLLAAAATFAVICACSGHRFTYWLVCALLFFSVFGTAHCIVLLVSVFRFAALPFVIVCFVPVRLSRLFLWLVAWLVCAPETLPYCRGYNLHAAIDNGRNALFTTVGAAVICVADGILTFVLTFGIVM